MTLTDEVDVLVDSLAALGVGVTRGAKGGKVAVRLPDGQRAELTVVTPAEAARPGEVVVADRIVASDRVRLDGLGVGWLDRRGHLKLRHGGMWLDVDVPPVLRVRSRRVVDPLAGAVVSAVSVSALLAQPEPMPGVRVLARLVGASPGGVSLAVRRLVDAGYLTRDRRAAVPGLFWAVADGWRPDWVHLATVSPPDDDTALVGDQAAAALGAPVGGVGSVIELLAGDPATVRRLSRSCGVSATPATAVARIALAPTPLAITDTSTRTDEGQAVAHPVIVALTLAGDPARGAEIVRDWDLDDRPW